MSQLSGIDSLNELVALLGAENVVLGESAHATSFSTWCPPVLKSRQAGITSEGFVAILSPGDTADVAALVTWANRNGACLLSIGGASSTVGSTQVAVADRPVIAVRLSRLNTISWDETSLTVTVGAGVLLADLEEQLNAHAYTLGSLPQSARLATVGGAVATEAFGLFATGYGGQRDLTLALEAVLPTGEIITTNTSGAAGRVFHHLLIGTEGEFGIITSATLAMHPLPEVRAWCSFAFAKASDAIDALRLVYRSDSRPTCVRFLDPSAVKEKFPANGILPGHSVLLFGFEGSEIVQTGHYQIAYAVCQQVGGTEAGIDGDNWFETERYRTDTFAANGRPGGIADVISVYASWSALPATYTTLQTAITPLCTSVAAQIGWADAHGAALDIRVEADAVTPEAAITRHAQILRAAQDVATETGARVAHHYGIGPTRQAWADAERGEAHTVALRVLPSWVSSLIAPTSGTLWVPSLASERGESKPR